MNDFNGYKLAQIGGLGLAIIMVILGYIGTYSTALFVTYIILMLVGAGIFYGARKLDEADRDRKLDEQSRKRKLDEMSHDE